MSVGCRYFADGNCLYGDKCKYGHNYPPASSFPNAQVTGSEYNRTMAPGMSPSYMYQDGAEHPEGYYDPQYSSDYYGGYSGDPAYGAATYGSGMGTGSAAYNYSSGMIKQNPMDPIAAQGNSWDSRIVVTQGGTTYFYPTDNSPGGTESQNRYMPSLPHIGSSPGQRTLRSFFVNEDIRNEFHKRATETLTVLDQNDSWAMRLPSLVVRYHSLYPLDKIDADKSVKVFGQITHLFKRINMNDRLPYVMRRIDGVHITNETATTIVAQWRKAQHPGIVNLREILTTTEFAETSVIFIYDYHPRSVTLADEYFTRSRIPVEEDIIWSYLVQLVSILRLIHEKKLACRVIHPSKVIITGKNRIRVSGVGILDALNYDKQESSPDFQKEDLIALGQLLLCICTRKANACDDIGISLEYIGSKYSKELVEIITNLISMKISSIDQINSPTFINHLYKDSVNLQHYTDFLESEVSKELESGRLFRLIAKLAFINDRPEYQRNPAWSESGDKYVLTLFRDYVFHQVYESGAPSVDMAHVIDTLNKLDAGSAEKIVLVSRNETVVMTVSYQDIKACLESAFKELQMTKATY